MIAVANERFEKLLAQLFTPKSLGHAGGCRTGSCHNGFGRPALHDRSGYPSRWQRFGEKYSVYSLRHFHAVNALRNGVGVFEVARNMGTSVQMIQEYYGRQATSTMFATRLED